MSLPPATWALFLTLPAITWSLPAIRASKPSLATSAGSSLSASATLVPSMPARSKNSVSVGPGCSAVTVTPVSFSSNRIAWANDCRNALEAA